MSAAGLQPDAPSPLHHDHPGQVQKWDWAVVIIACAIPIAVLALRSPLPAGGWVEGLALLAPLLPCLTWLYRRCRGYLPAQHVVVMCDAGILTASMLVLAYLLGPVPSSTMAGPGLLGSIGVAVAAMGALLWLGEGPGRSSPGRRFLGVAGGLGIIGLGLAMPWLLRPAIIALAAVPVVAAGSAVALVASGQASLDNHAPSRSWLLPRVLATESPLMVMAFSSVLVITLSPGSVIAGWMPPVIGLILMLVLARAIAGRIRVHQRAEMLRALAYIDPLTGLGNRRSLAAHIDEPQLHSVVMFDLDGFKVVNDELGHDAGDRALLAFAATLRRVLPLGCLLLRTGGDEFLALLPVDIEAAQVLVRRVLDTELVFGDRQVRASAGVVPLLAAQKPACPDGPRSAEHLMRAVLRDADLALRRAKGMSGNALALLDEPGRRQRARERALEAGLSEAMASGAVELTYRPIHKVSDGRVDAVRVGVCWSDAKLGLVEGAELGETAERCGLVEPLVEYCQQRTLRDLAGWRSQGLQVKLFFVVPSPVWFNATQRDSLAPALQQHGLRPQDVVFELPGSMLGTSYGERLVVALQQRSFGIGLLDTPLLLPYARSAGLPVDYVRIHPPGVDGSKASAGLQAAQLAALLKRAGVGLIAEAKNSEAAWRLAEISGASHVFASAAAPLSWEQVMETASTPMHFN